MEAAQIRRSFPVFTQDPSLVYLDNAATSQKPQPVIDRLVQYYTFENANIHRGNYPLSNRASKLYEDSKQTVCNWLDAEDKEEIVYTKGSTEAINLVAAVLREQIKPGDNIVTTELEHSSNYFPWKELCEKTGADFRVAKAKKDGSLDPAAVLELMDEYTKLLAITGMSNAIGFQPDLKQLIPAAHEKGTLVLVDGTQLIVHKKVSVRKLDCDFLSFSSHKLYGPMGLGVLYGKKKILESLPPFLFGGDMVMRGDGDRLVYRKDSQKFEAGTQNLAAVMGLKAVMDFLNENQFEELIEKERLLAASLREKLAALEGIQILNKGRDSPITLFRSEHFGAYDIGVFLGLKNIAVRCGSHCAYPLMKRMELQSACRISMGIYNTEEDVKRLITALKGLG